MRYSGKTDKRRPNTETCRRAEEAVLAVLPRSAKVVIPKRNPAADVVVNGQPITIEWAGEGRLGDIRRILEQRRGRPDVVVARRLSPGARNALTEAGVGWLDETGAAEIAVGSIVVSRTGRPTASDPRTKRWTPAVLAIAEALLCGSKPTVSATHAATGLSEGSCTNALRFLTGEGLLAAEAERGRRSGRRIEDPDALLSAYAAAAEALMPPLALQVGVTWQDPVAGLVKLGNQWKKAGIRWAATGGVAASVLAPHLTTVTSATAYVEADTAVGLEGLAVKSGLRVIQGGRLTLRPFPTVAVPALTKRIKGIEVAPWPRVYADVRVEGVRGEEAAEHLLEIMRGR